MVIKNWNNKNRINNLFEVAEWWKMNHLGVVCSSVEIVNQESVKTTSNQISIRFC